MPCPDAGSATHRGAEAPAIVGELDDVVVVVVALQVDRGHACGRAEVIDDVALRVGEHGGELAVPRVAFAGHDAIGQALPVGDAGPGGG